MRIVVAPRAKEDIEGIYAYIAGDNPGAADRTLAGIVEIVGLLASGMIQGREVALRNGKKVRAWPHPPYRIYYRIQEQELQVIRVYHQARRQIEL